MIFLVLSHYLLIVFCLSRHWPWSSAEACEPFVAESLSKGHWACQAPSSSSPPQRLSSQCSCTRNRAEWRRQEIEKGEGGNEDEQMFSSKSKCYTINDLNKAGWQHFLENTLTWWRDFVGEFNWRRRLHGWKVHSRGSAHNRRHLLHVALSLQREQSH